MNDRLQQMIDALRQFGRPQLDGIARHDAAPDAHEIRLSAVERKQQDIAARVDLLELQSDPRGLGEHVDLG